MPRGEQEPSAKISRATQQFDTWLNKQGLTVLSAASIIRDQHVSAGMSQAEQLQRAREIVRNPAHSLIAKGVSVKEVIELFVPSPSKPT